MAWATAECGENEDPEKKSDYLVIFASKVGHFYTNSTHNSELFRKNKDGNPQKKVVKTATTQDPRIETYISYSKADNFVMSSHL